MAPHLAEHIRGISTAAPRRAAGLSSESRHATATFLACRAAVAAPARSPPGRFAGQRPASRPCDPEKRRGLACVPFATKQTNLFDAATGGRTTGVAGTALALAAAPPSALPPAVPDAGGCPSECAPIAPYGRGDSPPMYPHSRPVCALCPPCTSVTTPRSLVSSASTQPLCAWQRPRSKPPRFFVRLVPSPSTYTSALHVCSSSSPLARTCPQQCNAPPRGVPTTSPRESSQSPLRWRQQLPSHGRRMPAADAPRALQDEREPAGEHST